MSKIRCVIVDDEPLARSRIRKLLKNEPDVEVAAECRDGFEAISAIRELKPDLLFLDIQMPEKDGFEVLDELEKELLPAVIFVTAYDQHALRAFQVYALDYLLKPFDQDRFFETMERARQMILGRQDKDIRTRLLALLQEWNAKSNHLRRILIKQNGRMAFVNVDDIDWIQAEGNYVSLHAGKSEHLLRATINSMENQLDPEKFMRIHRSTIVNISRIREIQQLFHGDYIVILHDGTKLKLSRGYKAKLPL